MEQILDQSHRIWYQLVPSLQFRPHRTDFIHSPTAIYTFRDKKRISRAKRRHQIGSFNRREVSEWSNSGLCGEDSWSGWNTELRMSRGGSGQGIWWRINDSTLFVNWQLRRWCYFCKVPVILILLFLLLEAFTLSPKPQQPVWANTIGAMMHDCDCWLCRAGSSAAWWRSWQAHSLRFPPTGSRDGYRHSGFQILWSCKGDVIFHNQA